MKAPSNRPKPHIWATGRNIGHGTVALGASDSRVPHSRLERFSLACTAHVTGKWPPPKATEADPVHLLGNCSRWSTTGNCNYGDDLGESDGRLERSHEHRGHHARQCGSVRSLESWGTNSAPPASVSGSTQGLVAVICGSRRTGWRGSRRGGRILSHRPNGTSRCFAIEASHFRRCWRIHKIAVQGDDARSDNPADGRASSP